MHGHTWGWFVSFHDPQRLPIYLTTNMVVYFKTLYFSETVSLHRLKYLSLYGLKKTCILNHVIHALLGSIFELERRSKLGYLLSAFLAFFHIFLAKIYLSSKCLKYDVQYIWYLQYSKILAASLLLIRELLQYVSRACSTILYLYLVWSLLTSWNILLWRFLMLLLIRGYYFQFSSIF